jgi:hypothetical protein
VFQVGVGGLGVRGCEREALIIIIGGDGEELVVLVQQSVVYTTNQDLLVPIQIQRRRG